MRTLIVAAALLFASSPALAGFKDDMHGIMAVSKVTGACGIVAGMAQFQMATKMDGGTEFLVRFIETEAARRGMSREEWSAECKQAVTTYDGFWKAIEEMEGPAV